MHNSQVLREVILARESFTTPLAPGNSAVNQQLFKPVDCLIVTVEVVFVDVFFHAVAGEADDSKSPFGAVALMRASVQCDSL